MTVYQAGFLGSDLRDHSRDICSSTPKAAAHFQDEAVSKIFTGGWAWALAATADGKAFSWGLNSPVVTGSVDQATAAEDVETNFATSAALIADLVQTGAGGFAHAVLVKGGKAFTYQLNGAVMNGKAPELTPVNFSAPVVKVAAGESHTLAITDDGNVWAFGDGPNGQLGDGTGQNAVAPVPINILGPSSGRKEAALAAPFTAIACGARHSCAVNNQGQLIAWGWSLHGQCGTGKSEPSVTVPTVVQALGGLKVVSVSAGVGHTLVTTDSGAVYTWGQNKDGQLGDGTTNTQLSPKLVEAPILADEHITKVAAGARHSVVLSQSGKVFAWGFNKFGQLGVGGFENELLPLPVKLDVPAKDVAAGWWHTVILA